jgi:hypothetical protein
MIVFSCYNCGLITDLEEEMAGKTWQCPACRQSVTIPTSRTAGRGGDSRSLLGAVTLVLVGLIPGVLLGGLGGIWLGKRSAIQEGQRIEQSRPGPPKLGNPYAYVDASDLYEEWLTNATDCDQTYKNKILEVTGIVSDKDDGSSGNAYVGLFSSGDTKGTIVKCHFDAVNRDQVLKLYRNKSVRIRGQCRGGGVEGITLQQCEVIE